MRVIRAFPLFSLFLMPLVAVAQPGGHRGPPPEAIEACEDLVEDDVCTVEIDDETVEGVCKAGPRADLPLACRPEGSSRGPGRRGPPPADADL